MYYLNISSSNSGFTNQVFALITGIMLAIKGGHKAATINYFKDDVMKEEYTPINKIFDIPRINAFLKQKYDFLIFDKSDSKDTDGKYISNSINWINAYHRPTFEDILPNIFYIAEFTEKSEQFLKDKPSKLNVIHLRLEDDALTHWAKQNRMEKPIFKKYLENKYIRIIVQHILKDDMTIILSSSFSNGVIDFLKSSEYNIKFLEEKFFVGREKNAIVDFLIGTKCNNVFICNFNFKNLNGSTFSYYIAKTLDSSVKKICVDLDRISDTEEIIF
jgi:hypothetical protein